MPWEVEDCAGCDEEDAMTWGVDIMARKAERLKRGVVSQSEKVWRKEKSVCSAGKKMEMETETDVKVYAADFDLDTWPFDFSVQKL